MNKRKFWVFLSSIFIYVMASYATLLIDAAIGASLLGKDVVSVVDLVMPVSELFFTVTLLFGVGADTLASIAYGRGDYAAVRRHFTVAVISEIVVLGVLAIVIYSFIRPITGLLCASSTLYDHTLEYLSVIVIFSLFDEVFRIVRIFTAMTGRPQLVMTSALVQMFVNVLSDWFFVAVCGMGIKGLAMASLVSTLSGGAVLLPLALNRDCPFKFVSMNIREAFKTLKANLSPGFGYMASDIIYIFFYFSMNAFVLRVLGENALFCWSVVMMAFLTCNYARSAAQEACISLGGQSLGISDNNAYRQILRRCVLFVSSWAIIIYALLFAFPAFSFQFLGVVDVSTFRPYQLLLLLMSPFVIGNNVAVLRFIRYIQIGRNDRYLLYSTSLYLFVPFLFYLVYQLLFA